MVNVIIRTGNPSKFDQNPFGTLCKTMDYRKNNYDLYIQINKNDANPSWQMIGSFSEQYPVFLVQDYINSLLKNNV